MKDYNDYQQDLLRAGNENDALNIANELLAALKLEKERNAILVHHIEGSNDYPMNLYHVTTEKETITVSAPGGENKAIRKIYSYMDNQTNKIVARIYEQNWFAGYGVFVKGVGYVGLMDD